MSRRASAAAVEAYRSWYGRDPDEVVIVEDEDFAGQELVQLGRLAMVGYIAAKHEDEEALHVHWFGEEGGEPPHLAVSESGRLVILGGDYTVEPRGIVD